MRNLIQVLQPTTVTDTTGQETYTYSPYKTVYASYERDGFKKNETGVIQASGHEEILFKLRYDPNVGYNWRVIFNGITYRVIAVDNYMNLRHELRLKCVAVDL